MASVNETAAGDGWKHSAAVGLAYYAPPRPSCEYRVAREVLCADGVLEYDTSRDLVRLRPSAPDPPDPPDAPDAPDAPGPSTASSPGPSSAGSSVSTAEKRSKCVLCYDELVTGKMFTTLCGHVACDMCDPRIRKRKACIACGKPVLSDTIQLFL